MRRLNELRSLGHPLALIGAWATIEAATIAWLAFVPGEPSMTASPETWIVVSVFVVIGVAFGSRWAWWIALALETLWIVAGLGFVVGAAVAKGAGLAILSAAAFWLLWSGNIELYVLEHKRRRRLAS